MPTTTTTSVFTPTRPSARRALAAATIAVLSFAGSQIPLATAHAAPAAAITVVRPNWGHCSTPGVPC